MPCLHCCSCFSSSFYQYFFKAAPRVNFDIFKAGEKCFISRGKRVDDACTSACPKQAEDRLVCVPAPTTLTSSDTSTDTRTTSLTVFSPLLPLTTSNGGRLLTRSRSFLWRWKPSMTCPPSHEYPKTGKRGHVTPNNPNQGNVTCALSRDIGGGGAG